MTHETILTLIETLNSGTGKDRIFLLPLTATVDTALVWTEDPTGRSIDEGSHRFYFFRESVDGRYVGAVYDMVADIHVVVCPEHRRRGWAKWAMGDIVLPHLRSLGREEQRTRLCSPEGERLAEALGFVTTDGKNATLSLEGVGPWTHPRVDPVPIDAVRMEAVRCRIAAASDCLRKVSTDLHDRAGRETMRRLFYTGYFIEDFLDEKPDGPDEPDYPETPSRIPLDDSAQQGVEKLINKSAGWLRMAADELTGRHDPKRVERLRALARRVINVGGEVRDDRRHWQTRAFLAQKPPGSPKP